MDIAKALTETWNTYKSNFVVIILAMLVVNIISMFTLGLLASVMFVGFMMMFVKAKRGQPLVFNDVFAGFSRFFQIFFGAILIALIFFALFIPAVLSFRFGIPLLGAILILAAALVAVYLAVVWMFPLLLIYDKKLSIEQALKESRRIVTENNFWMHFLLLILIILISSLGSIMGGMGLPMWLTFIVNLLTTPLAWGTLAYVYEEESK